MSSEKGTPPEKNVPIYMGPNEEWPERRYVSKFFDDPDFVGLELDEKQRTDRFSIFWATEFSATETLQALRTFIKEADLDKGSINLAHTFRREGQIIGGSNFLRGRAEDVIDEVHDNEARVRGWWLGNKRITVSWGHAWPKTWHQIPINEMGLHVKKVGDMSRMIVDQCMADTAMPGLRSSIDVTLDEFAEHEPLLRKL